MKSKFLQPLGAQLVPAFPGDVEDLTDATGYGVIAHQGIEGSLGETEITYTDNSKTVTSVASNKRSFVVSANTNLFVGQAIKVGNDKCVITGISGTTISVDVELTAVATDSVTESAYYSVYRKDKDAASKDPQADDWSDYANYFFIEPNAGGVTIEGQVDLVFENGVNISDYYVNADVSIKPISMVKPNDSNAVDSIYVFKPF